MPFPSDATPGRSDPFTQQQAIDRRRQTVVLAYFYPFPAVLLAAVITEWVAPALGGPFLETFTIAVLLNAFYGGVKAGLLAATLAFFCIDYFFVAPVYALSFGPHYIHYLIFIAAAVAASWLSGRTVQLTRANLRLKEEVAQRLEAERAILDISQREQVRLGQDLHDGLCQTLVGTRLLVEELANKSPQPDLEKIEERLTDALAQADAVSRGLYPVELERRGLMAALEEMTLQTSKLFSVECRLKSWEPVDIDDAAAATHLYRIAQEAVANAAKGGRAKRIVVRIFRRQNAVVLRIADNGIGLVNAARRSGMGMKIMEYRARVIGASLRFRSFRRGGTVVSCMWRPADAAPAGERS